MALTIFFQVLGSCLYNSQVNAVEMKIKNYSSESQFYFYIFRFYLRVFETG